MPRALWLFARDFGKGEVDSGGIGGYNEHIINGREEYVMLNEKDMQAVSELVDEKISASEKRMSEMIDDRISASERRMQVLIENTVAPKFDLVMEALDGIREQLVPRSRVDDLEDEVKFLKVVVRQMSERMAALEKAN